jgi:hypothetical protein
MTPAQIEHRLAQKREAYHKNRDAERAKRKVWYEKNRERVLENRLLKREFFPEKVKSQKREFYRRHRDRLLSEMRSKYSALSPEDRRKKIGDWAKRNRTRINEYIREYRKDPNNHLAKVIRNRIHTALKRGYKASSSVSLLGCSIDFLKTYLSEKFVEGMSWENHSRDGWHVDHIIPCSMFDMSDPAQQRACFHYTNLQPLWAGLNISKGNRLVTV